MTSHYLDQWWLVHWRIFVSLSLNGLNYGHKAQVHDFNINTGEVMENSAIFRHDDGHLEFLPQDNEKIVKKCVFHYIPHSWKYSFRFQIDDSQYF